MTSRRVFYESFFFFLQWIELEWLQVSAVIILELKPHTSHLILRELKPHTPEPVSIEYIITVIIYKRLKLIRHTSYELRDSRIYR